MSNAFNHLDILFLHASWISQSVRYITPSLKFLPLIKKSDTLALTVQVRKNIISKNQEM